MNLSDSLRSEYRMTSLSDYLRAEQADRTEPASFYSPGCDSWSDPRRRHRKPRPGGLNDVNLDEPVDPIEENDLEDVNVAALVAAALDQMGK